MNPLLPWPLAGLLAVLVGAGLLALGAWGRQHPRRIPRVEQVAREVGALALLGALVAGFFWRPLFTADVWLPIGGGDLASFFYPLYSFIYRSIQAGQFPLWNPYAFGGMPLAADVQSGLFYPPNLLAWFTLPSYDYGTLEWLLILHYCWAILGMYVWLRDLRLRRPASIAGAAAFAFCGFMAAHFGHMPMIFTAAWLPWNLLLARRAATQANPLWVALAGLALGCTLLAGHPQTALYEGVALALYWLFLLWNAERGLRRWDRGALLSAFGFVIRRPPGTTSPASAASPPSLNPQPPAPTLRVCLVRLVVLLAIAAGLSAVQVLPAAELAGQSLRAAIPFEEAGQLNMQPVGLLELVLPRVYGANPLSYWVPWQSTETWGYLGAIALLLAGAGLFLRRDRRQAFPLALGLLALLLMVGPFSILFSWLAALPGFDKFRAAGRFLLLLGLANATLAALGLDTLMRLLPHTGGWRLGVGGWGLGAREQGVEVEEQKVISAHQPTETLTNTAPFTHSALPNTSSIFRFTYYAMRALSRLTWSVTALTGALVIFLPLATVIFLAGFAIDHAQSVLNDLYMLAVWLGLTAGVLWAVCRGRLRGQAGALVLAVLLVLDLFSPNSQFNPTSDDILRGYEQPAALDFLRGHTGPPTYYRIDSDTDVSATWQPLLGTLAGIPDAGGLYNPLELQRYATYWDLAKANRNTVLYDLLSIKYTLTISPDVIADPKFTRVAGNVLGFQIGENIHADPRLFVVHDAQLATDDTAALGQLLNGTILGWHSIYVDGGRAGQSATPSTLEAGNPGEQATITGYTPNEISAQLDLHEPGWAVFSEVWYPGWEAVVDGQVQPGAIQRADTLFRAVYLPAGQHTVVLRFNPPLLTIGLLISLATLLLSGAGGALAWTLWRLRPRSPLSSTTAI